MRLGEMARRAVDDLVDVGSATAGRGLDDLHRRRRRADRTRAATVAAAVLLVVAGVTIARSGGPAPVDPADSAPTSGAGALIGVPADVDAAPTVLSGSLPPDSPLERVLSHRDWPRGAHLVRLGADGSELSFFTPKPYGVVTVDLDTGDRTTAWRCEGGPGPCSGMAVLSPDGRLVAHLHGFGNPVLDVIDRVTGKRIASRPGGWAGPPSWAPDSTSLALPTSGGVVLVEPGSPNRVLTEQPLEMFTTVSWSPDGSRLAYAEPEQGDDQGGRTDFSLVVVDVADASARSFLDLGSCVCRSLFPPPVVWSPAGDEIATATLTSDRLADAGEVLVVSPDGEVLRSVGRNENFVDLLWQPAPGLP